MGLFLKHACDPVCVKRAIQVALVIGTIHALLNHFDEIINGSVTTTNVFQMLITYLVPYTVATHGSAMHARHIELEQMKTSKDTLEVRAGDGIHRKAGAVDSSHPVRDGGFGKETNLWDSIRLNLQLLWKHARDPVCMKRALQVALVVGTIIGVINHYDEIINGTLTRTNYLQMGLTYTIPYMVNTYGSARQASYMEISQCR